MKIIEGFTAAKIALARGVPSDSSQVSEGMRRRLREMFGVETPEEAVRQILDEVWRRGDVALFDYARKIDNMELASLEVSREKLKDAVKSVDPALVAALRLAAERVRAFHTAQKEAMLNGISLPGLGQLVRPLERVGVYVPGGTASYPSTVLMTAIPARVAGVKEIILVSPPRAGGAIPPLTLAAAEIAGVDRVFSVGGAQAIAALAYGTESVPRVDKICGPGNIFVMLAKKLAYGTVGIDGLQGPSEVLILAGETANPIYCAADLLAQAEHDNLAAVVLVTTSSRLAREVEKEVARQVEGAARKSIIAESLQNGIIAIVDSMDEAIELANLYAPEHLCLLVDNPDSYLDRLHNAGCIVAGLHALLNYTTVFLMKGYFTIVQLETCVAVIAVAVTVWVLLVRWGRTQEAEAETETGTGEPPQTDSQL